MARLTNNVDRLLDQDNAAIERFGNTSRAYTVNIVEIPTGQRVRGPVHQYKRTIDSETGIRHYTIDKNALAHHYNDPTGGLVAGQKIMAEWTVGEDGAVVYPVVEKRGSRLKTFWETSKKFNPESIGFESGDIREITRVFDPETEMIRETRRRGPEVVPKRNGVMRWLGRVTSR